MSRSPASRTSTSAHRSRRKATHAGAPTNKPIQVNSFRGSHQKGIQKRVVRKQLAQPMQPATVTEGSESFLSPHRRKVLWAGGAIALLATATVLPTQVSSQAIAQSNCEQVIKSGAEISRGQISQLLAVPAGASKEAVRQVVSEPYCTLPAIAAEGAQTAEGKSRSRDLAESAPTEIATEKSAEVTLERDAYPLAFDPEAWVVLTYEGEAYAGYDFVFKP